MLSKSFNSTVSGQVLKNQGGHTEAIKSRYELLLIPADNPKCEFAHHFQSLTIGRAGRIPIANATREFCFRNMKKCGRWFHPTTKKKTILICGQ